MLEGSRETHVHGRGWAEGKQVRVKEAKSSEGTGTEGEEGAATLYTLRMTGRGEV